jgi:hypothetical protein
LASDQAANSTGVGLLVCLSNGPAGGRPFVNPYRTTPPSQPFTERGVFLTAAFLLVSATTSNSQGSSLPLVSSRWWLAGCEMLVD